MENKSVWTWNGREYPFDISESESMARMNDGLNELRFDNENLGMAGLVGSSALREQCMIIRKFFDTVFGEGMGEDICGKAYSASAHTMAYMEFILFVNSQVTAFREAVAAVEAKYKNRVENIQQAGAYGA